MRRTKRHPAQLDPKTHDRVTKLAEAKGGTLTGVIARCVEIADPRILASGEAPKSVRPHYVRGGKPGGAHIKRLKRRAESAKRAAGTSTASA